MSNVKPGDMAKIVKDHTEMNLGVHVLVTDEACQNSFIKILMERAFGQCWVCILLQHAKGVKYNDIGEPGPIVMLPPGYKIYLSDNSLKRIDPPADTESVFGHEPLPGERWIEQQQLPAKERWSKETES